MAVYRAERNDPYTHLYNKTLRDSRLSYKARGLLSYMLSMSDNWKFYTKSIVDNSDKDGRDSVLSGLRELEKYGYLQRKTSRGESGKFDAQDWIVFDTPTFSPQTGFPDTDKPDTDNPQLRTNNIKNYQSKEPSCHKSPTYDDDSPYFKLASFLSECIAKNNPKAKLPNLQKWSDDMRKLVEIDKRSLHDVSKVIKWSQIDPFWSTNILSASKLRKQFDQLYLKMTKEATKPKPAEPQLTGDAKRAADEAKAMAEQLAQQKENSAKEREAS